ncbi:hypothetical protein [Fodinibius sp. Rm-B-1B1-1]|uniref:hypothetical protein n=1 Tax=Fodinibius alkaliphilus TaxID=3140241 RepID=UPI00315AA22B
MRELSRVLTLFLIAVLPLFMGCEGPVGEQGPQGSEGSQGPVGPAGDDGSMIYSGTGVPASSIGSSGDYYLDTNTGEMYGPKDDNGWGNPIIVLMGQDGQDGEDGSQIHAGTGAPASSLGANGDFYLDKSNYDMYGPKTDQGWGSPINLKGADGNANVTRYIFPGHDFSTDPQFVAVFTDLTETEMKQSSWSVYLMYETGSNNQIYYSIPGRARNIRYSVEHNFVNGNVYFRINTEPNQTGIPYDQIEMIRTEANNTQDNTKVADTGMLIPGGLDTSDYKAVADYYGFYQ